MGGADRQRGSILETVGMAGWLSRGPEMPPAVLDLLDSAWDDLERTLDATTVVSGTSEQTAQLTRKRCSTFSSRWNRISGSDAGMILDVANFSCLAYCPPRHGEHCNVTRHCPPLPANRHPIS